MANRYELRVSNNTREINDAISIGVPFQPESKPLKVTQAINTTFPITAIILTRRRNSNLFIDR